MAVMFVCFTFVPSINLIYSKQLVLFKKYINIANKDFNYPNLNLNSNGFARWIKGGKLN